MSMSESQRPSYIKRNFALNTMDGISFFTGMIFLSPESVLPVYIEKLGASPLLITLIPVLRNLGVFFPAIFVARYMQTLRFKKPYLLTLGLLQRIPWLITALIGIRYGSSSPHLVIWSVLGALFITHAAGGVNIPAFFDLTVKTIPLTMRGRLFALRNLGSYLVGLACGGLISWILNTVPSPGNFPVLMLIGFAVLMLYLPAIGLHKEPPTRRLIFSTESFGSYLRSLGAIPASNPDFRRYIVGRIFFALAFTSYSYFAVRLVGRYGLHESEVGVFTIIIALVFIVANPVLGVISDRYGHLVNHHIGAAALFVGNIAILLAPSYPVALISIAMGALTLCVNNVSQFAMTVEFGEEHEIPVYIGIVGLAVGAASLLIIPVGFLANIYGLDLIFWGSLGASLLALIIFLTVEEPRKHRPPTVVDAR